MTISQSAAEVWRRKRSVELAWIDSCWPIFWVKRLRLPARAKSVSSFSRFSCWHRQRFVLTGGMVICPCSMGTVAAIAHGLSENLIHRAADVHLKERRKLILVPRETPMQAIGLRNLAACADAGAVILPAMPAFYTRPRRIEDCIDFIVGRICDQLGVEHQLFPRWGPDADNVNRES